MRPSQLLKSRAIDVGFDAAVALAALSYEADNLKKQQEKKRTESMKDKLTAMFGKEKKTK